MSIQLSFETLGISSNEFGELVSPTGTVITREFLLTAMKYNTTQQLADEVLGVDIDVVKTLLKVFGLKQHVQLTRERVKIMGIIQRYHERYQEYPTLDYVSKRLKEKPTTVIKDLRYLHKYDFIEYRNKKIVRVIREVV